MVQPPTAQNKNYKITRKVIHKGTSFNVYEGEHKQTGKQLAFKIINLSSLPSVAIRQYQQEIDILQSLSNLRATPQVYDVIQRGSEICLVMEKINGKKISSLLNKYPTGIPNTLAPFLFMSILSAINEIHSAGVCHRELSLESLMFDTKSCSTRILDFSASQRTRQKYGTTTIPILQKDFAGIVHYVAPEVLKTRIYDGTKADIWSIGVIFYTLLFNKFPFDDISGDTDAIFKKIADCSVDYPHTLSSELRSFLDCIFTVDPSARPSALELQLHPFLKPASHLADTPYL